MHNSCLPYRQTAVYQNVYRGVPNEEKKITLVTVVIALHKAWKPNNDNIVNVANL